MEKQDFKEMGRTERLSYEGALEGIDSGKVQFIRVLCNPKQIVSRKDGKKNYLIVGYEFKSLVDDLKVPVYPMYPDVLEGRNMHSTRIKVTDINKDDAKVRTIAKDEIFHLNLNELALFMSKIEIAGKVCGLGGPSAVLRVLWDKDEPIPVLKREDKLSIRTNEYNILDMTQLYGSDELGMDYKNGYKYAKLDSTYSDLCFIGSTSLGMEGYGKDLYIKKEDGTMYIKVCGRAYNLYRKLTLAEQRRENNPKIYAAAFRKILAGRYSK